jgi:hypothetical protein
MTIEKTPAFVATVRPDHTIELPVEVPIGSTVAVIVMPATDLGTHNQQRQMRFTETLAAIRAASFQQRSQTALSDEELDALVERAKKQPGS